MISCDMHTVCFGAFAYMAWFNGFGLIAKWHRTNNLGTSGINPEYIKAILFGGVKTHIMQCSFIKNLLQICVMTLLDVLCPHSL